MKQTLVFPKVAKEMFWVQLSWTLWFLGIVLVVNIIRVITSINQNTEVDNLYNSIFIAGTIYMLVIGIIAITFLPHYVENGVTRKDYFKGTVLAAIGLSIVIPISTYIIWQIQLAISKYVVTMNFQEVDFNSIALETEGNIISDVILSIIFTPYVDPQEHTLLALFIFIVNLLTYYVLGWLISVGFYRFNIVIGLAFIITALIILICVDTFMRMSLGLPVLYNMINIELLPSALPFFVALLLIIGSLFAIRFLTKRVAIKI